MTKREETNMMIGWYGFPTFPASNLLKDKNGKIVTQFVRYLGFSSCRFWISNEFRHGSLNSFGKVVTHLQHCIYCRNDILINILNQQQPLQIQSIVLDLLISQYTIRNHFIFKNKHLFCEIFQSLVNRVTRGSAVSSFLCLFLKQKQIEWIWGNRKSRVCLFNLIDFLIRREHKNPNNKNNFDKSPNNKNSDKIVEFIYKVGDRLEPAYDSYWLMIEKCLKYNRNGRKWKKRIKYHLVQSIIKSKQIYKRKYTLEQLERYNIKCGNAKCKKK
eukprot:25396_1